MTIMTFASSLSISTLWSRINDPTSRTIVVPGRMRKHQCLKTTVINLLRALLDLFQSEDRQDISITLRLANAIRFDALEICFLSLSLKRNVSLYAHICRDKTKHELIYEFEQINHFSEKSDYLEYSRLEKVLSFYMAWTWLNFDPTLLKQLLSNY